MLFDINGVFPKKNIYFPILCLFIHVRVVSRDVGSSSQRIPGLRQRPCNFRTSYGCEMMEGFGQRFFRMTKFFVQNDLLHVFDKMSDKIYLNSRKMMP